MMATILNLVFVSYEGIIKLLCLVYSFPCCLAQQLTNILMLWLGLTNICLQAESKEDNTFSTGGHLGPGFPKQNEQEVEDRK